MWFCTANLYIGAYQMKLRNNLKKEKPSKVITDLRHLVKATAEEEGDRDLYIYKEGSEFIGYTFNQLWNEMNYLGTAFSKLSIMGKAVAVSGDSRPQYVTTYLTTVNGNGCIVPIDKDLSVETIADFLEISKAVAFVYSGNMNKIVPELAKIAHGIEYFIPLQPAEDYKFSDKVITFAELIAMGKEALDGGDTSYTDIEIDMDNVCALLFTSGTTGTSKAVMLTHKNLTAATNSATQSMEYDNKNTFVAVLPLHHSYEMTCLHLAGLNIGAQKFINDSLKHVVKNMQLYKPNTMCLVPLFVETMHKKIWDGIRKQKKEKLVRFLMGVTKVLLPLHIDPRKLFFGKITETLGGNLKSIVCGGAPLSPELVMDFHLFGITIVEGYGITECSPLVAVNRPSKIKLHSVGTPVENCQVKIDVTNEDGTGEILVKGDNVMLGYYNNPEANAEVFTEDGWFRTGDIGYMDKDDAIYITGRKKNVIILSNGKNVFPEELEEHLATVPEILESVVLTREADNGEKIITAIIVPNKELLGDKTDDEIYAFIKDAVNNKVNPKLPSFKQMRRIEIRNEPFERTTSKKIMRFKVK